MSIMFVRDKLAEFAPCDDSSCCCIPKRTTVVLISMINLVGCLIDMMTSDACLYVYCEMREKIDSVRKLLITLFQMANLLLLIASIFESPVLVDIYVWYTLAYIVMGFVITIYEFVCKVKAVGARSLITFLPEVAFFFVIFRCLPLVDLYRKHLYKTSMIPRI